MDSDRAGTGLLPGSQVLLALFSALTLLAVIVLFGRPGSTGEFFAWTINPPLTAAWLGAGYGSGCVLVALSFRSGYWPSVRVPLLTIGVFTAVTLLATLLHLNKFHLHGPFSIATAAGWFWLCVYIVIPPAMLVLWLVQDRQSQTPRPETPLPRWLSGLLGAEGVVMLVAGVVMFAVPSTAQTLWPWPLTPLTARAVAAWLIAFGLATGFAALREGLAESRVQAISYAVFGALELVALLRFPGTPDWSSAVAWVYLGFAVAVTATGVLGVLLSRPAAAAAGSEPAVR